MKVFEDKDNIEYKIVYSLLSQKKLKTKYIESRKITIFLSFISKITYNSIFQIIKSDVNFDDMSKTDCNVKEKKWKEEKKDLVKISKNDKYLVFEPGSVIGGKLNFDCKEIPISKFLIPLLILSPFSRKPFDLTLKGVTNARGAISVDSIRLIFIKIMNKFGVSPVEMKIIKRGFAPLGQGELRFFSTNVSHLNSVEFKVEKIFKIRGMAITSRVNSSIAHDMINKIKDSLKGGVSNHDSTSNDESFTKEENSDEQDNELSNNVKIFCDIANRNDSGPSPGYQSVLFAEGQNFYFGESCRANIKINNDDDQKNEKEEIKNKKNYHKNSKTFQRYDDKKIYKQSENYIELQENLPEVTLDEVVDESVFNLLDSIDKGGAFDYKCNALVFSYICLNLPDINMIEIGNLNDFDIEILKLLNVFFGFKYDLRNEEDINMFVAFGVNYKNYFKVIE